MMLFLAMSAAVGCALTSAKAPASGDKSAESQAKDLRLRMVRQPADIAPSAYQYRADRKPDANPPESWIAVMHFAHLPLNQPVDVNAPAVKSVLCALLWEEIRPVRKLVLTWPKDAKRRPPESGLALSMLVAQSSANSWWNNLSAAKQSGLPSVSNGGRTYTHEISADTCGIVLGTSDGGPASRFDVPAIQACVDDTWKQMDVEVEWGFQPGTAAKDFSGRIETYDGHVDRLARLKGDTKTTVQGGSSWGSPVASRHLPLAGRRGIRFSLLYMGTSKWRKVQPFITQPDDVARTIVTVWTKAGSFSFLAADLENGPIYAPEYGFFVHRTSALAAARSEETLRKSPHVPMAIRMNEIAGDNRLIGWGTDQTPWFGGNPTSEAINAKGIEFPPKCVAMHPGPEVNVAVGWRSPIRGTVQVKARLSHAQSGSNGVEWWVILDSKSKRRSLVQGTTDGNDALIPGETVKVEPGDVVSLVVGPNGDHRCDTNIIEFLISEKGGRTWNLAEEVASSIHADNPHADSFGNPDVWSFYSQSPQAALRAVPSEPPIEMGSKATSAREYLAELKKRGLRTIRGLARKHAELTWDQAVAAFHKESLPPTPAPPKGEEPAMQVEVPSARLTAQWKLGVWHLSRHCAKNPANGRRWFNDFPYGILAAETYMILRTLDLMGAHEAAEDGFSQWTDLPMDPKSSAGHHEWALADRPNGLFTEGHGCLTHAVGPDGYGGQMDGVHAFGPGAIGWALSEHYWMSGNKKWLSAVAPRILANAEWMLRQRKVLEQAIPGGTRLWAKGLLPALQVTPDSGGQWMQFYECEAYYWAAVSRLAETLAEVDPAAAARLKKEADAYRRDLKAAVERSIALSPVVPVRDGTFHSVIPFACYVRGLATGAWGWQRDGSGSHVGPLYWETVQSAEALVSPAGLLPASDVRVQGYLDVLEDRLLLENPYVNGRPWIEAGWQYQLGLERTANLHLAGDDPPVFLRSWLNGYATEILVNDGYTFNEHAVHGPPDKIYEEAAWLERFRNLLVMEDGDKLWLCRATPREWLQQGRRIAVKNAPTHFGAVGFEVESDVAHGRTMATVEMPAKGTAEAVQLRLRHPKAARMKSVSVNGKPWKDFEPKLEVVKLHGLKGTVKVVVGY